ncbi:DNA mismatch repair protein MutS [Polaribacter sp. ALD11]|uniref:MutS-related protein n=1 Tax=Polaribacter sp. ALD11 TaxID=2058137 RepID=UPI000C30812E|nr:DNA mismatch repair protein MutS [Polaribacter sp. ALD11]AUC84594.1 DNA mismatch repair protein MutS [Polaribacter sp. ALD11]
MNYFLGISFIFVLWFLIGNFLKKRKLKKIKAKLYNNWGKQKKNEYYNFFVIGKYFENNRHKEKAYHILSEKSKIDLDIDEIFKFVDRTSSKIGQQYLYFKLRTIGSINDLLRFDELTTLFQKNKKLSISCQFELSKLNTPSSYYLEELINGKQISKPKNLWVVKLLSICSILSIALSFFSPIFILFIVPLFAVNSVFHYKNKGNVNYYLQGIRQLSKSLKTAKKLSKHPSIKEHFNDFLFIKSINSIMLKSEFIGFEKNINNEWLFPIWLFIELNKILFNVEYIVFYSFLDAITKEKKSIESLFLFIGEVDAAISTASLKSGHLETCTPTFNENNKLNVRKIYHPLIEKCIANDVNLSDKSMLLTGSNMSGKSTFIRTVAINSILAQTLHLCFADAYSAPFYKLYSSIRITDDLLDNVSYYLQEVLTIKELIDVSTDKSPCLFVLDEIFKGTNTIERISGGKAILSYLNKKNNTVLVSTHDIELTELLEKDAYKLYHFSEDIKNNNLFFDHKIKEGKLQTRNAIKILNLYKYPSEIIKEAKEIEKSYFS